MKTRTWWWKNSCKKAPRFAPNGGATQGRHKDFTAEHPASPKGYAGQAAETAEVKRA